MSRLELYLKSLETVHEEMAMFIINNAGRSAAEPRIGVFPQVYVTLIHDPDRDDQTGEYTVVVSDNGRGIPLNVMNENLIPKAMVMGASDRITPNACGYGASLVVQNAIRTRVLSIDAGRRFAYTDFSHGGDVRQVYPTPYTYPSSPGVKHPRNDESSTGLIFAYCMPNEFEGVSRPKMHEFIVNLTDSLSKDEARITDFRVLKVNSDQRLIDCIWDDDPNITYGAVRLMNMLCN